MLKLLVWVMSDIGEERNTMKKPRASLIYLLIPVVLLGAFCLVNFGPLRVPKIMLYEGKASLSIAEMCLRRGWNGAAKFWADIALDLNMSACAKLTQKEKG